MARSQDATNGFKPIQTSHFARNYPIADDAGSTRRLETFVENQNSRFAQTSPAQIMSDCSIDGTAYMQTNSGAAGSSADIYAAFRGRWGAESRNDLYFQVECQAGSGTTGEIRLRAEGGATNTDNTVSHTSWDDETGTVAVDGGGDDEIITLRMWRTAGSGTIQVRKINAYMEQMATALPSGVEDSTYVALDDAEFDQNAPMHVQAARTAAANIYLGIKGRGTLAPVCCYCHPLRTGATNPFVPAKTAHWSTDSDEWTPLGPPIPYFRTPFCDRLRYHLFGAGDVASLSVRLRSKMTGAGSAHTVQTSAAMDASNSAHWATGTIDVVPVTTGYNPVAPLMDLLYVEGKADGTNDVWVYSCTIQEDPN